MAPTGLLLILLLTAHWAWRGRLTPGAVAALTLVAAAVCFAASPLALSSIFGWVSPGHLGETVSGSRQFVHNLPFDLQLLAVASVLAALAVRRRPLQVALSGSAALALLLLVLLPLLEPLHPLLRPTVIAHYLARTACGPFVVAILAAVACCRMTWFSPLKRADLQSGRLLAFALASLVAMQVPDARLTWMTVRYMDRLRAMTAATSDVVIEDSPLAAYPEIVSLRDLSWLAVQVRVLADRPQQIPNFKRRRDGQQTAPSLPDLPSRFVWRP